MSRMVPVARRNLFAEKGRFAMSVGGVAFAVLLILIVVSLYRGWSRTGLVYLQLPGNLWVAQAGTSDPFHSTSLLPADREPTRRSARARNDQALGRGRPPRAWGFMGAVLAALVLGGYFFVLLRAGWSPGDAVSAGSPLHHAYLEATTMSFAGIVACQVGTTFAARTARSSLRAVGVFANRLLLWGIAFELAFAAGLLYFPPLQSVFATAPLSALDLLALAPFPLVVWGTDELRRLRRRALAPAM